MLKEGKHPERRPGVTRTVAQVYLYYNEEIATSGQVERIRAHAIFISGKPLSENSNIFGGGKKSNEDKT